MKLPSRNIFLLSLLSVAIVLFIGLKVHASQDANVTGFAWSSNTGWISMNDCTDITDGATCGLDYGGYYGVNILPTAPGTVSGYAWSSNIGWITFNAAGCPTSGCTPGARATWNGDGSGVIKGWARACSIYVSGCSGAENSQSILGGWDGYIALDAATAGGPTGWGLNINTDHTITGYAWGSDVVGWIGMSNVKVSANLPPVVPPTIATPSSGNGAFGGYCAVNNPSFTWTSQQSSCTITRQDGTSVTVAGTSQAQGGATEGDGLYYYTPNLPVSGSSTTYTLQCGSAPEAQVVVNQCVPDYILSATPSNYMLTDGTGAFAGKKVAIFTVSVVPSGYFNSPVTLSMQSFPSNMPPRTSTFSTSTLTPSNGVYPTATLTIAINPADLTETTTYTPVVIQGSGASLVRTVGVSIGAVKKRDIIYIEQ